MLSSLSPSTYAQYQTCFQKWWTFCGEQVLEPWDPQPITVVMFLQYIIDNSSVTYSTLNMYRSALSLIARKALGSDPLVTRFLKGVSILRPPAPRYEVTWDPQTVLQHLERPINELPGLAHKLVTLLLLATGQRLQTIAAIKLSDIHLQPAFGVKVTISSRLKNSRPHKSQPCLLLPFFPQRPLLCVATLISRYLTLTGPLRAPDTEALFILCRAPYTAASRQTLSKWVSGTLRDSGVDDLFKPHSTRHASVSAAKRAGAPVDIILRAAGWSNASKVFATFYDRPLAPPQALLPHVVSEPQGNS